MTAGVANRSGRSATNRRGVLLLVVLSMLTLFLMLGAAYLLTTTRALETSKAYSRLTLGAPDNQIPHAQLLDRVMLQVLRGGTTVKSGNVTLGTLQNGFIESLLADKYGLETITGTMTSCSPVIVSSTAQQFITGQLSTGTVPLAPTALLGRVLTFDAPGRPAASFRIVRSATNGFIGDLASTTFDVAAMATDDSRPFIMPRNGARVVINGREFAGDGKPPGPPNAYMPNEPWDGFDENNDFLASLAPSGDPTQAVVLRGSFLNTTGSSFTLSSGTFSLASGTLTLTQDIDGDGAPDFADNDNDGAIDGAFVDFGIPDVIDRNGVATQLRASVLVVPLDGRINVNLHGSYDQTVYGTASFTWPPTVASGSVPLGSGYGPSEVDLTRFTLTGTQTGERPFLLSLAGGPSSDLLGMRSGTSRFSSGTTYRLASVGGRYGETAGNGTSGSRPGMTGTNDTYSRVVDQGVSGTGSPTLNYGVPPQWWSGTTANLATAPGTTGRAVFNSPPDLHGRMKTLTGTASGTGLAPHLQFVKPDWSGADGEVRDDPYETRIDTRRGFGGSYITTPSLTSGTAIDNPFTPAELEAVLRPYDLDSRQRAPRLTTILGSAAERLRTEVTTDAWDTTAIVGGTNGAAGRIFGSGTVPGWLTFVSSTATLTGSNALTGVLGGEVTRGERFNLNRPIESQAINTPHYSNQRQAYFKDLYTLLVMLQTGTNSPSSTPVDAIAQWAANAVEFRDADSVMTAFEYDINPRNGWTPDGNVTTDEGGERRVVWGAERPEILLRETFAWENNGQNNRGILIGLHRPWKATAYSSGTSIAAETCDPALDQDPAEPTNRIDLAKKSGADAASYPVWRLRIVDSGTTRYVRFDTETSGSNQFALGANAPPLGTDADFWVVSGTTIITGTSTTTTGTAFLNVASATPGVVNNFTFAGSGTAYLERISNPLQSLPTATGSSTWYADPLTTGSTGTNSLRYVVVDEMPFSAYPTNTIAIGSSGTATTFARATDALWKTSTTGSAMAIIAPSAAVTNVPRSLTANGSQWFPWPNRPYISAAELLLVPQKNSREMLTEYQVISGTNQQTYGCPLTNLEWLFDSVHVPSRFAGVNPVTTNDLSTDTGVWPLTPSLSQFSNYREPGRVNLNVVTSTNVWNAVVAGALPAPATSATAANLALATGSSSPIPARSLFKLLALSQNGTVVISDSTTTTTTGSQAPLSQDVLAWNRNPMHTLYTATRLANTVTPRSNVFAVWVTLRKSVPNDPDSVRLHRGFYIIDRSIPVGFEPGEDHNVMDCVRLRRIIE